MYCTTGIKIRTSGFTTSRTHRVRGHFFLTTKHMGERKILWKGGKKSSVKRRNQMYLYLYYDIEILYRHDVYYEDLNEELKRIHIYECR